MVNCMPRKYLSQKEKTELKKKTYKELLRLERIVNDVEDINKINHFKNYFNLCETTYKVILKRYTDNKTDYMKLDMRQVPSVMLYGGYKVDKSLLSRLFGSQKQRGNSTAKILRDKTTHGLDEKAVEEIKNRWDELFDDMNSFLDIIRKQ